MLTTDLTLPHVLHSTVPTQSHIHSESVGAPVVVCLGRANVRVLQENAVATRIPHKFEQLTSNYLTFVKDSNNETFDQASPHEPRSRRSARHDIVSSRGGQRHRRYRSCRWFLQDARRRLGCRRALLT